MPHQGFSASHLAVRRIVLLRPFGGGPAAKEKVDALSGQQSPANRIIVGTSLESLPTLQY
jgi:hypothetical protein